MSGIDELDPSSIPVEFLKEGSDWVAAFNPRVQRVMDVKLENKFIHDKVVCSVRFSGDTRYLAVGVDNGVSLYDMSTGGTIVLPFDHAGEVPDRDYVRSVSFSHDGRFLAAGCEDKSVRVWDLESRQLAHTLSGHRREVYAVEYSSDGKTIVSGSGDRTLRLWDLTAPSPSESSRTLVVEDDLSKSDTGITTLAISPDGDLVASGALDGSVRIWNIQMEEPKAIVRWQAHQQSVYSVRWVLQGKGLVTGSLDRTLKRWEIGVVGENGGKNECVKTMVGHRDYVLATATVQEGYMLRAASASRDGTVRLWDLKTGQALFFIQGHTNTVTSVDLSSDGKLLASGSGDGSARIWSYTLI